MYHCRLVRARVRACVQCALQDDSWLDEVLSRQLRAKQMLEGGGVYNNGCVGA